MARRGRTFANETRTLPPPADEITPEVATRWFHRHYVPLAGLAELGAYPDYVRGLGRRELNARAARGLRGLSIDVRRITAVCGMVLATGRPVKMRLRVDPFNTPRQAIRRLRMVLRFEERRPHRGARGILQHALRDWERIAAESSA